MRAHVFGIAVRAIGYLLVELLTKIANVDGHWNGHSSAIWGRIAWASNTPSAFAISKSALLAKGAGTWQSSELYSQRLSWSLPSNPFSNRIEAKRRAGIRLLDLTRSNPTEVLRNYPHSAIRNAYGTISDFSYTPDAAGKREARETISRYYEKRGVSVSPDQLFLTASTSEAYALLFKLFCNPGDEILAPIPSYPLFEYLAALESVRIVPYQLRYDGSWHIDSHHLRSQISSHTRAIVVVNPNNPTGSLLKNFEASELSHIAHTHHLPIISDEVFFDYALLPTANVTSTLAAQSSVLAFSLNGLSKTAGMPQMKLGWIAMSGPIPEMSVAKRNLELLLDTYLSVGIPVQIALPELLKVGNGVRAQLLQRIRHNFATLKNLLDNTTATCLHTEAGWSAIVRLTNIFSEEAWTTRLLEECNVIVQPGYFFDMPQEAYIVISLITPEDEFETGVSKIREFTRS